MSNKAIYLLAAIFCILLLVSAQPLWSKYVDFSKLMGKESQPGLVDGADQAVKVTISQSKDKVITLTAEDNSWKVNGLDASEPKVDELLTKLNSLTVDSLVSTNPEKFVTYT